MCISLNSFNTSSSTHFSSYNETFYLTLFVLIHNQCSRYGECLTTKVQDTDRCQWTPWQTVPSCVCQCHLHSPSCWQSRHHRIAAAALWERWKCRVETARSWGSWRHHKRDLSVTWAVCALSPSTWYHCIHTILTHITASVTHSAHFTNYSNSSQCSMNSILEINATWKTINYLVQRQRNQQLLQLNLSDLCAPRLCHLIHVIL